jgi:hypothetical protein
MFCFKSASCERSALYTVNGPRINILLYHRLVLDLHTDSSLRMITLSNKHAMYRL